MAPATNVCSLELSSEGESQWKVAACLRAVSLKLSGVRSLGPTEFQARHGARWFEGERTAGEKSCVGKVSWRSLACRLVA